MVLDEITGEVPMKRCVEPLHHDVGYVLFGGDVFDCKTVVFLNLVSDPVVFDVHIPGAFEVHDSSVCNVDRGLVVAEYELLVWKGVFQLL